MPTDDHPEAPESLPNYLADGLPKQTIECLTDTRDFVDELIEWNRRPVEEDELPDEAEPVDDDDQDVGGTVVLEKVTCGDETCKCMTEGKKHGPYLYRYYREGGKLTSEYLGKP